MPSYLAVKVEMPSVAGGGQMVIPKSVRLLVSAQWPFAGGLFLAVLSECKGKILILMASFSFWVVGFSICCVPGALESGKYRL